jgi:hypothetical protein
MQAAHVAAYFNLVALFFNPAYNEGIFICVKLLWNAYALNCLSKDQGVVHATSEFEALPRDNSLEP